MLLQTQVRLLETQHGPLALHRALGVTLWELFCRAAQPYAHLSGLDVLSQVIRERAVKLPKPPLEQPFADRWLVASVLLPNLQKHRVLDKEVAYNRRS